MKTRIRMCSVHKVVEVLPGIWKLDRFPTNKPESVHYDIKEIQCPACVHIVTEAFKAQLEA